MNADNAFAHSRAWFDEAFVGCGKGLLLDAVERAIGKRIWFGCESDPPVSCDLKLRNATDSGNHARIEILEEILQMFAKVFVKCSLCLVFRVFNNVTEPHGTILPVNVSR